MYSLHVGLGCSAPSLSLACLICCHNAFLLYLFFFGPDRVVAGAGAAASAYMREISARPHGLTAIQYNTSWRTEAPPGTNLQADQQTPRYHAIRPICAYAYATMLGIFWGWPCSGLSRISIVWHHHCRRWSGTFQHAPSACAAAAAGVVAAGRIWDLRTGRSVHVLEGHVKQILSVQWAPNGWHIATGSDDHSAKVGWG
jgi:hypothetical protein